MLRRPDLNEYLRFQRVDSVVETPRGLDASLHGERLLVEVIRDDVVRISISRGGVLDEQPTFAVEANPLREHSEITVALEADTAEVATGALVVRLGLEPFTLDVHRPDGSVIAETWVDDDGRSWAYATLNDSFVVRRRCGPADAVYGLGEKTGSHNRRGRDFTLWNTDILNPDATAEFTAGLPSADPRSDPTSSEFDPYYMSIPFFHHQTRPDGAIGGSFVDNGFRASYEFSHPTEYRVHFDGGHYVEYLFAGPEMADVVDAYTWLTGRPAMPPMWALGYHQCRWHAYDQAGVEIVAERHRSAGIPCDAVWLDIEHMDGYRVFTFDRKAFPDPEGLIRRLADDGFKVITIVDPGVKHDPGWSVFDEAAERGLLCLTEGGDIYVGQVWPGRTAFPDFATEATRTWWGRLNAEHLERGVAGIWNDMNEPATGIIPPDRMRFDRGRGSHERYHNQYALMMAMGTVEGLLEARPNARPFVLTRAGSAGIQRYSASWTGDNMSRWDHLWLSIPMTMGLGVSGQPFAGSDVGGFRGIPTAELFLRWMQYGALTPFFRNHAELGSPDRYAWAWGSLVEDLARDAVRLRYRLLPYIYSAFVKANESGAPVQRPLVFDHQRDPVVQGIDDEYLFGPDLLVAPVVEPGTTARQVYLPEGEWHDWHTGERIDGQRFVGAATPMERIPMFARGGSVIPMWPEAPASTADHHPEVIELHVFSPGRDATRRSMLQEDDGATFAFRSGGLRRTIFELEREGDTVTLRSSTEGEGYPEFRRTSFHLVVHGDSPSTVSVDGQPVSEAGGRFVMPNRGEDFTATFTV